jgi:hypothetical protein
MYGKDRELSQTIAILEHTFRQCGFYLKTENERQTGESIFYPTNKIVLIHIL